MICGNHVVKSTTNASLLGVLAIMVGCASTPPPDAKPPTTPSAVSPVIPTEPEQPDSCPFNLEALVGTEVTLRGIQTRTKVPTVCGVDVDGDYELSDRPVKVSGVLEKYIVEPPDPDEPVVASRGAGTYYRLVSEGRLSRTHPDDR